MSAVEFRCFECDKVGPIQLTAEARDRVYRVAPDPTQSPKVTVYCTMCGAANDITLTRDQLQKLLHSISSNDPGLQKAIDDARRGNYSTAIAELGKRFKL